MKTLEGCMPRELFYSGEFNGERAIKFKDVEVIWELNILGDYEPYWPGPQRNVHYWVKLANGYAVGWNENPSRGWSFPVIKIK